MKPISGNKIKVIGVMSGTSLDGLGIAAVEFQEQKGIWIFEIITAETIPYSNEWSLKLQTAPSLSGKELTELDSNYGRFTGNKIKDFVKRTAFTPELIASHGHTVFHQPEKHFTLQIGNGAEIAAVTKMTTVADFRTADVALSGQGAPLVPIGDRLLFSNFEYCLNLGGFANVSFEQNDKRIAFDICPVNFVLNYFANKHNLPFDESGNLGKLGKVNAELFTLLNKLEYYSQNAPKSLGREWVENIFFPVLESSNIPETDKFRTVYEHIAFQISKVISGKGKLLITGGGAYNSLLIERIKHYSSLEIIIPDSAIINYKEALIFAFLGVLKLRKQINCLSSVTGANKDSSVGQVFDY